MFARKKKMPRDNPSIAPLKEGKRTTLENPPLRQSKANATTAFLNGGRKNSDE